MTITTDDELTQALAEFSEALHAQSESMRLLSEEMRRFMGGADDGLLSVEQLRPGQYVKVWDEWPILLGVATETTLQGDDRQILVLSDGPDRRQWRYECGDGERFAVDEPW